MKKTLLIIILAILALGIMLLAAVTIYSKTDTDKEAPEKPQTEAADPDCLLPITCTDEEDCEPWLNLCD